MKSSCLQDVDRLIMIAKDKKSSSDDLDSLFGVSGKLDILLAAHPNASPSRLRELSLTGSDAVKRKIIKHPSLPFDENFVRLANIFPEDFLKRSDAKLIVENGSDLVFGLLSILETEDCPVGISRYLAQHGSMEQREIIYKRGLDPDGVLTKINGKVLAQKAHDGALKELESMSYDGLDDDVKQKVSNFLDCAKPFAIPIFSLQDRSVEAQRLGNLIGGYPYTSDEYPWPLTDGSGLPMQPLFQLDLLDVGCVLGVDLGSGLLQVWARVDCDRAASLGHAIDSDSQILIRNLSLEDIKRPLTNKYPDISPWELQDCHEYEDGPQPLFSDLPDKARAGSVIRWLSMGSMWPHPFHLELDSGFDDYRLRENIMRDLESYINLPTSSPEIYLGGHGGQAGGWEDPTMLESRSEDFLVIRAKLGLGMNIGVLAKDKGAGGVVFDWVLKYY